MKSKIWPQRPRKWPLDDLLTCIKVRKMRYCLAFYSDFYKYQFLTLCPRSRQEIAQKLNEIQNLASATLKITSWPQQPRSWVLRLFDLGDLSVLRMGSGILFQKLRFWNQCKDYLNDSDLFFCFSRDNTTATALIVVTNRTGRSIKWGATSRTIDFGGRATFGVRACVRVDSTFSVHFQIRCYVSSNTFKL